MSNHFRALLESWHARRDDGQWVLGTVYATERSSYRKAGAHMLFHDDGQQFGMLSGGCLEADMQRRARQVMQSGESQVLCYDSADEDDVTFLLGIGCGGVVHVLLQAVRADNAYLQLPEVLQAMRNGRTGRYRQCIAEREPATAMFIAEQADRRDFRPLAQRGRLLELDRKRWLETPLRPPPHLLIAGGGADARPLAALADQLGWQLSIWDPRPANARAEHFPAGCMLLRGDSATLGRSTLTERLDAAVVMTHSLRLDAEALRALQQAPLQYLALLGPAKRREAVLAEGGLAETDLPAPLSAPAGLDLGAELPEGIALAILAECHAMLTGASMLPLSHPDRSRRPIRPQER